MLSIHLIFPGQFWSLRDVHASLSHVKEKWLSLQEVRPCCILNLYTFRFYYVIDLYCTVKPGQLSLDGEWLYNFVLLTSLNWIMEWIYDLIVLAQCLFCPPGYWCNQNQLYSCQAGTYSSSAGKVKGFLMGFYRICSDAAKLTRKRPSWCCETDPDGSCIFCRGLIRNLCRLPCWLLFRSGYVNKLLIQNLQSCLTQQKQQRPRLALSVLVEHILPQTEWLHVSSAPKQIPIQLWTTKTVPVLVHRDKEQMGNRNVNFVSLEHFRFFTPVCFGGGFITFCWAECRRIPASQCITYRHLNWIAGARTCPSCSVGTYSSSVGEEDLVSWIQTTCRRSEHKMIFNCLAIQRRLILTLNKKNLHGP